MADLFPEAIQRDAPVGPSDGAPLADRLRPVSLDEIVGQEHLTGPEGAIGRMVAAGHWRDYGLSFHPEVAIFAAFRRATERPEVRIEKRPQLRAKQGAFALVGEQGAVLKRGHDLGGVLAPLERRLMRLVGA